MRGARTFWVPSLAYEGVPDAMGFAFEPQQPPMMDHAANHRCGHLAIPEDLPSSRELQVGHEHDRLPLAGGAHQLEQKPRSVDVEWREPQLANHEHPNP